MLFKNENLYTFFLYSGTIFAAWIGIPNLDPDSLAQLNSEYTSNLDRI
jgi:hypothetical protein